MISGVYCIYLLDIDTEADESYDRVKKISNIKKYAANVDLVGIQTQQLGQSEGFRLSYSIRIRRAYYDDEKYVYLNGNVYEIKSMSKSTSTVYMLLNVVKIEDAEIVKLVKEAIG